MTPAPLLLLREQRSRTRAHPPPLPSLTLNPRTLLPAASRLPHQSNGSPLRVDAVAKNQRRKPPSCRACSTTPSPEMPPLPPLPSFGALRLALIRPSTRPDQIRPIQSNPSMAATCEEEHTELELEAPFSGTSRGSCAQDRWQRGRIWRHQQQGGDEEAPPVIPSWGRHWLRSVLEDGKTAEMDGAANPDTPLAFFPEEDDYEARKTRAQEDEQRGVVATLS